MRYVPAWFPGAGFQKLAQRWGAELHDVTERPYAFVKHQMATGKAETSFLSQLIETSDETPFEKFVNKWSAMALYTAGADTVRFDHFNSVAQLLTHQSRQSLHFQASFSP